MASDASGAASSRSHRGSAGIAAGGAIDTANPSDPNTAHFNRLHERSTKVEGAVILLGIVTVALVAYAETVRDF